MSKSLTLEMLQQAVDNALNAEPYIPQRIISTHAHRLLMKSRKVQPEWDMFSHSTEIYWKAKELGLKDD